MASLSSRPSVGRKPIGHATQQQGAQLQNVAAVPYAQAGYQQQQQQQQQMQTQIQQPTYVQGQQQPVLQQNGYQQQATQHPQMHQQHQQYQQPIQRQPLQQQPALLQQQVQQRTAQQWPGQQQQPQQTVYQGSVIQQQQPQQQTIYQQQTRPQPVPQQTQQRPVQQYQQPVQQQPAQQYSGQPRSVQQLQQRLQQGPVQQQSLQQQPLQQQPIQQQPIQQQPLQQQFTSQTLPNPSNAASHAINRRSISSAASVRSIGSVTSSHTNPSQALGSSTSFPASISQQDTPNFISCTLCSTDITNDSSHLECLACTAAQVPTLFCTPCCVSKGAVTNHHHHMSNLVSPSDVVIFDPEISAHGWDVRKSAIGIAWYHHKGSKIKTFDKPKPPIPVAQPQTFPGHSNLDDGWEEIKDPDGRLFYYHRATKVSKWTRPLRNQLPPGWVECTNPDGRTYYLNNITQATTWERPSATGATLDTTGWSPTDKRHSLSSQGQNTATPQSPTSIRSSTILETSEWSPEVETTTSPAFRTASVPNNYIETVNWSPSDPTHRPIPTRADTTPLPSAYDHYQYGNTRHSRTFSKDSLSNMRLPPGSAAATKAVVNSTKTAASATAKGVKVAAKKLKNSKNAQRIVAGVGMAAVNAVLIDQFGISIPVGVGTAAVGLVNSIDFDKNATVADVTDTDVTADNGTENSVNVSGDGDQSSILDGAGNGGQPYIPDSMVDTTSVNTTSNIASNEYIVGGDAGVVQTTVIQEEIVFIPGAPVSMVQQPQQIRPTSSYGGAQPNNNEASRNGASGSAPGTSEWEFESIMQRPAAMIGSHIPIHVPRNTNQRAVPGTGFQTQRTVQHQGSVPVGHGNLPPSHIPVHSHRPPNTMPTQNQPQQHIPAQVHNPGLSQASHQPGWAGQPQIIPQYQGQNQQHLPNQPQTQPLVNQAQTQMPNQQQGFQPQGLNQAQFNQQANQPQPQWSQSQTSVPQRPQNQHPNKPPGAVPSQPPSKPLLKPQQKAALMKAGMKIGTSLLKSAIRSSMSGNSGGDYDDDDDDNDNDNSFGFGDTSNDGGNDFDSSSNLDNNTADYDPQDQVQDQSDGQAQQFDNGFAGSGFDTGTASVGNDFGGNDQLSGNDNFSDSGAGYSNIVQDQVATDTSGDTTDLSAQAGFDTSADTSFNQQQAIDLQAQEILQTSMNDDNAAMNGFFTAPDFNAQTPSIFQTSMQDDNAAMNGFYTTPEFTTQAPGLFQASMADDNAAMNGFSTSSDTFNIQSDGGYDPGTTGPIDPNFSQDTIPGASVDNDSSSIAADNLWTVNLPDTSSLQPGTNSQAYAGLTSASLSGPMFDYYDSFAAYGGEIPLDEESDEDQSQDLATNTNISSDPPINGLFQGPTLSSTDLDTSQSSSQDLSILNSPVLNLGANQQASDQSQDSDNQSVTQVDDTGSTTPTNTSLGMLPPPQVQSAALSQLYDGSAYDDPDSAGNSPSNTQALTPTGMGMPTIAPVGSGTGTGMSGLSTSNPSTPPVLPITPLMPDPMPNPALLTVGQ